MLQTQDLLVLSDLKYGFTYALHLWHLKGVVTGILWTLGDPKGWIQTPIGKLNFLLPISIIADVGLQN